VASRVSLFVVKDQQMGLKIFLKSIKCGEIANHRKIYIPTQGLGMGINRLQFFFV
jgi:hypothetical protein